MDGKWGDRERPDQETCAVEHQQSAFLGSDALDDKGWPPNHGHKQQNQVASQPFAAKRCFDRHAIRCHNSPIILPSRVIAPPRKAPLHQERVEQPKYAAHPPQAVVAHLQRTGIADVMRQVAETRLYRTLSNFQVQLRVKRITALTNRSQPGTASNQIIHLKRLDHLQVRVERVQRGGRALGLASRRPQGMSGRSVPAQWDSHASRTAVGAAAEGLGEAIR